MSVTSDKRRVGFGMSEPRLNCQFVGVEEEHDIALVHADGYELPRVGFDRGQLSGAGVAVGQWFTWCPKDGSIRPDGHDPTVMTPADLAELNRLMEESKGWGPFPIYEGDGE